MATLSTQGNRRFLQWPAATNPLKRHTLSLGKMTKKQVAVFKSNLDRLVSAKNLAMPMPLRTAVWLTTLDPKLYARLAECGLVDLEQPKPQANNFPIPNDGFPRRQMFTYFVQRQAGGPIKIGRTENVEKRLASLQGGHPEPLVCLCRLKGDKEDQLHYRFRNLRISGEWFSPGDDLMHFIRLAQGGG